MKKLVILSWIVMAALVLGLAGCKDSPQDNDEGARGDLQIGSKSSKFWDGAMFSYGPDTSYDGYAINMSLSAHKSGMKYGVYFEMYSSSNSVITPGTYNYTSSNHPAQFTFGFGWAGDFYDAHTPEIVSGTMIVAKEGTTYTITFDCVDNHGAKVVGNYKGDLRDMTPPTPESYMRVGNKTSELFWGILVKAGSSPTQYDGYSLKLILSSYGSQLTQTPYTGVTFTIYSSSESSLAPGTYQLTDSGHPTVLTFNSGKAGVLGAVGAPVIVSGEVIVAKDGTTYTITFNCTDSKGKKVTGHYKGELPVFNPI